MVKREPDRLSAAPAGVRRRVKREPDRPFVVPAGTR